ncbi:putative nuclease HARBI1 [Antedon mediterranea]|uniref:putative nuclease HARBI1 n=1 Tax=Antedon mediterranea TaxID=105859 RepID=UPI003AF574F7
MTLSDNLAIDLNVTNRNNAVPPVLQVCTALRFYASGSMHNISGDLSGIHESTACRIVRQVSLALQRHMNEYVFFPMDAASIRETKIKFHDISGFPNVIGAVDGTHVRIQAPTVDEFVYVNRKGYHSLNIQVVCDANMRFTNCVVRWPGSTHDSRIFRESGLGVAFENGEMPEGYLLGDSGYALRPFLLTPFINPITREERRYNNVHSITRSIVERTIGAWKRRFRCMHEENRMQPHRTCAVVAATMVLHNMARNLGLPEIENEEDIDIGDAGQRNEHIEDNNGRAIRQMVANEIAN